MARMPAHSHLHIPPSQTREHLHFHAHANTRDLTHDGAHAFTEVIAYFDCLLVVWSATQLSRHLPNKIIVSLFVDVI